MTTIKPTSLPQVGKKQERNDRLAQALRDNLLKRKQQKRERSDDVAFERQSIEAVYLTIDDAPSSHLPKKIALLKQRNIPALFFCRGESIVLHKKAVVEAIQQGFWIGNHSFSHPKFSTISLEACLEEILKTEELIEDCYRLAGIKRPHKLIRFPFGDRGENAAEKERVQQLQTFLKKQKFVPLKFKHKSPDGFVDAQWEWDTKDYKKIVQQNPLEFLALLEEHWQKTSAKVEVLLLHDFEENHALFEITLDFLQRKNISFLEFDV